MGEKRWLTTFVYTGFRCTDCPYEGQIEISIPYLVRETEQPVFAVGDKVQEGYAGITEHFDGFFCPECLKNNKPKIRGVRIILENGVFTRCVFD